MGTIKLIDLFLSKFKILDEKQEKRLYWNIITGLCLDWPSIHRIVQLWVVRFSPIPTQPKYNFVEVFTVELFPKPNPDTSLTMENNWRISLQSIAIVEGLKIKRGLTSYLITVEEKVGVEPTEHLTTLGSFQDCCIKPLYHFSKSFLFSI